MNKLLEVKNLRTCFFQEDRTIPVVDDVSFFIKKNSVLGMVGESGCGKTMTALSITKLLPARNCKIVSGNVDFTGCNINQMNDKQLRKIRGKEITYIFQEPTTSLNPVFTIKEQLQEVILLHREDIKADSMFDFMVDYLKKVGIRSAKEKIFSYPHQLSGGEKQRVMIAMGMIPRPKLLIADEPTTALDVTIQAQILLLLKQLKEESGLSILFISHDLNTIAELSDYIAVMYAGQIVEFSKASDLIKKPAHPYTQGLFDCLPKLEQYKEKKINTIPGEVPKVEDYPQGCRFATRCPKKMERCFHEMPPLFKIKDEQEARCWLCSGP